MIGRVGGMGSLGCAPAVRLGAVRAVGLRFGSPSAFARRRGAAVRGPPQPHRAGRSHRLVSHSHLVSFSGGSDSRIRPAGPTGSTPAASRPRPPARRRPKLEARAYTSDLTAESVDAKSQPSTWRGYYHTTGQAPPRLAFSDDWLKALETLPSSRVFKAIRPPLVAVASFAALVTCGYECGFLTTALIPAMHHLLGVPLGLLLVLRATTARERSWTARQSWQSLTDFCREGCRRAVSWCGSSDAGREAGREICGAMLALVAATESQTACEDTMALRRSVEAFASQDLLDRMEEALGTSRSATVVAAAFATAKINSAHKANLVTEFQYMELDNVVSKMAKAAGECECIGRTPTPMEYHMHCTRFLVIFCFSLPFVFSPNCGWSSVLICTAISYALMGLDEIASVVEAPFQGYLPLKALWAGLRSDVVELLSEVDPRGKGENSSPASFLPC